ncbi:MAG: hypothetical protein EOO39_50960, partial [Cytophagaceae bacterium]
MGVTKGYMFDANGNSTLSITSAGTNLAESTIDQMLVLTDVSLNATTYDHLNRFQRSIYTTFNSASLSTRNIAGQQIANAVSVGNTGISSIQNSSASGTAQIADQLGGIKLDYQIIGGAIFGVPFGPYFAGSLTLPDTSILGSGDLIINTSGLAGGPTSSIYFNTSGSIPFGTSNYQNQPITIIVKKSTALGVIDLATLTLPSGLSTGSATFQSKMPAKAVFLKAQPIAATSLTFAYRSTTESNSSWSTKQVTPFTIGSNSVAGLFSVDVSNLLADKYEFKYVALDSNGTPLNSQSGTMDLSGATSAIKQNENSTSLIDALLDKSGTINL